MDGKNHKGRPWWPAMYSTDASRPLSTNAGAIPGSSVPVVWTNSPSSQGRTREALPKAPFRGGRTVQLIYAFIDVCIVVANGTAMFLFRFSQGDPIQYLRTK